jgi:uncharacterized protein
MNYLPSDEQDKAEEAEPASGDHQPLTEFEPNEPSVPEEIHSLPLQDPQPEQPRGIAPVWHTVLLVAVILAFSIWGAFRSASLIIDPIIPTDHKTGAATPGPARNENRKQETPERHNTPHGTPVNIYRLSHYAISGSLELVLVVWVALGLHLRKIQLRSVLGDLPRGLNNIAKEAGIAALFWLCSMVILASFALTWNLVETVIYTHELKNQSASHTQSSTHGPSEPVPPEKSVKLRSPQQEQVEMTRKLMQYAPANGLEIAAWGVLCLIVGFSEEIVFRGYLQRQGIAILRRVPAGVLFSAIIFGAAHGYQGVRGICIIALYGALFSGIALLRRNLFPGMLAHSWHDFATGLMLALIRETHLLDRMPLSQ